MDTYRRASENKTTTKTIKMRHRMRVRVCNAAIMVHRALQSTVRTPLESIPLNSVIKIIYGLIIRSLRHLNVTEKNNRLHMEKSRYFELRAHSK